MATQNIYAPKAVSVTYARSHIKECLDNGTTALLNNNKVTGYIVNAETFESIINTIDGLSSVKQQLTPDLELLIKRAKKALCDLKSKSPDDYKRYLNIPDDELFE
ncbi:hypothetical protein I3271_05385 [Photobacterium leiognathi]|uniref:hypothetical protein n=1 Tax=Photobacterium leiognathi TaxID=553611 RepID=UPI001EDDBE71|nr:hypothetical protein [Photobacterium leiognathi]MCG3884113.1 hypothetical protein [Photobacterium leiognathi]